MRIVTVVTAMLVMLTTPIHAEIVSELSRGDIIRVTLTNSTVEYLVDDVSADTNNTYRVALGDLNGPVPVPSASSPGALLALFLLVLGGAAAGLSRRRRRSAFEAQREAAQ